ncbi:MAG: hypothetical protein HZB13_09510 [Acidobacteria bacterium]|nr:hypothetical protein [Acidobacteriota bacterium]
MPRPSRIAVSVLLAAPALMWPVPARAAEDWNKPPFPNWSDSTIARVVTDSPWAKRRTVPLEWRKREERPFSPSDVPGTGPNANKPFGSPVGGIGVPRTSLPYTADILIRWASALPVRQAKALYRQRDGKLDPSKIEELTGPPESDYVLEIYGVPAEVAHRGTGSIEALAVASVTMRTARGRVIKPGSAEAKLTGSTLTILVHFPRTVALERKDEEIECRGDFQIFRFAERFKLSSMMYLGRLEL